MGFFKENDMAFTLESRVGEILKDETAVDILEKYAPGVTKNPLIRFAKGMTLEQLLGFPQVKQYGITKEMVIKVLDEIEVEKKKFNT
jgi:hypothetical protein